MDRPELIEQYKEVITSFRVEIRGHAKEVDEDDERDWFCMSYGYFLGKGVCIDDAYALARHVRYNCEYWC